MNKAVYWFTQDLRLSDNKLLNALLGSSKHMAFVYVIDPTWFEPRNYQHKSIGLQRWLFLCQSLRDLNQQLINKGHHLWLLEGDPSEQIQNVIQRNNIDCLGVANQVGWYEQQAVRKIRHGCPSLDVQSQWHTTLFNEDSMMDDMPMSSFSRFRQYVETTRYTRC
ncbi:deoxyribodipyrimidine photo-lyase [Pseudomonas sp. HK3]